MGRWIMALRDLLATVGEGLWSRPIVVRPRSDLLR